MRLIPFLPVLCLAACGGDGEAVPTYEGPYRHLVLISLDTTRADHLSCYETGRARTPSLDALAQAGTRFADVTAAANTTLSSHTSLMTGSWPHTHGVVRNGFVLHQDNVMLAELLGQKGFHTAGFLGSFALESRFAFNQGFDYWDEEFSVLITPDGSADQNQRLAEDLTAAALAHVDEVKDEAARIFLFLQYFDPHAPYGPPVREGAPQVSGREVDLAVRAHQRALVGREYGHSDLINTGFVGDRRPMVGAAPGTMLTQDQQAVAAYAGEVAYMDRCLGDLIAGLDEDGILDETIIVVTADHGETMYEHHDFWNHGLWLYQTVIDVPLIVRLPDGRGKGQVVEHPVSTIDVLPTLCQLLELDLPERSEGMSLVPFLDGEQRPRGTIFSEATQPGPQSGFEQPGAWGNILKPRAVRRGPWKLILSRYNKVRQLFHLGRDPDEKSDLLKLATPDPEAQRIAAELLAELIAWEATARPLPSRYDSSQYEDTLKQLEGMGYAGGGGGDEKE